MTEYLTNRSRQIFSNQRTRSRKFNGEDLPYTLDELRRLVIIPGVSDPFCPYCKLIAISESTFTVDHRVPLIRGGSWQLSNLIVCCASCNTIKGCMTSDEYKALRTLVHDWNPYAANDLFKRLKVGGNPMAMRILASRK
jgi:5-methylcytosine-specific restriction endonuclease McrA